MQVQQSGNITFLKLQEKNRDNPIKSLKLIHWFREWSFAIRITIDNERKRKTQAEEKQNFCSRR